MIGSLVACRLLLCLMRSIICHALASSIVRHSVLWTLFAMRGPLKLPSGQWATFTHFARLSSLFWDNRQQTTNTGTSPHISIIEHERLLEKQINKVLEKSIRNCRERFDNIRWRICKNAIGWASLQHCHRAFVKCCPRIICRNTENVGAHSRRPHRSEACAVCKCCTFQYANNILSITYLILFCRKIFSRLYLQFVCHSVCLWPSIQQLFLHSWQSILW